MRYVIANFSVILTLMFLSYQLLNHFLNLNLFFSILLIVTLYFVCGFFVEKKLSKYINKGIDVFFKDKNA